MFFGFRSRDYVVELHATKRLSYEVVMLC